ncbi:TadE/TadG family type IV pilus assembly protein [Myxococcus xanthus]|uniref:TadE/TadG family type IV pilus assembly protein n=1 Tax=Myxococcus xanthus TaxID=34 RepID=UPI00116407ED|nr:Tad domain-containing protein [Myxococcus xanthus]QDF01933.1 pilus assembly protein [Myxococcus xanthus]
MNRSHSRGQTMVLFALGTLLMVLMVTLTLSFTMKVRERIEAQTVADAAAFSNAVATARTFNNIAVINRVQIAHAVAQAGAASLVSWASLYRAQLNAARGGYSDWEWPYQLNVITGCPCAWKSASCARRCRCGSKGLRDLGNLQRKLRMEDQRVNAVFQAYEPLFALQMRGHQLAQNALYLAQQQNYQELKDAVDSQRFTNQILSNINPGANATDAAWQVPPIGGVNKDELTGGLACTQGGAVCDVPATVQHAVNAAMGSRGFHFVTWRQDMDYVAHLANLAWVINPPDMVLVEVATQGTTHFGKKGRQMPMIMPFAPAITAEDEGSILYLYNHMANGGGAPCPAAVGGTEGVEASLVSSGGAMPTPEHRWTGGSDPSPYMRHMLMPCMNPVSSCPGIWPLFLDYNLTQLLDGGDNNYGQPKNFAVVQRNLRTRELDPWDYSFRYRFERGSTGTQFDNRSFQMADGTANDVQTAMATGIAYFHRGHSVAFHHWSEPPNLLNPFWRATLVAADTDESGLDDAANTLDLSAPAAARTLRALRSVGYRGIQ